jgi:hypothetical protein
MDAREQFQTDEFFRYAAECSRMAGLARREMQASKTVPANLATKLLRYSNWVRYGLTLSPHAVRSALARA